MNQADAAVATAADIAACESMGALEDVFSSAMLEFGLTACASGMVTGPKSRSPDPFHFTSWPKPWLALYLERDFLRKDPIPRWAIGSGLPVRWSELKALLTPGDPGHEVFRTAEAWGFTEGIAVPVRSRSGALGLVSCGGDRKPLGAREQFVITSLSTAAFHKADELSQPGDPPAIPGFTSRERAAIRLLHQGLTDSDIARTLGISLTTARSHLNNARMKVGARSRTHLISLTADLRSAG